MLRSYLSVIAVLGFIGAAHSTAHAGPWDINLGRLCNIETQSGSTFSCGGGYSTSMATTDPVVRVIPDNAAFRSLMSEMGVIFAPNIATTSDTMGFAGFSFSTEFAWVGINPKKNATDQYIGRPLRYWRAAKAVSGVAFADPTNIDVMRIDQELPSSFAPTFTLMARKGLWLPLPSFELGLGVKHLIGSRMWAPTLEAKLAIHEGFHGWPVPSFAVRGTGVRVMGTPDFNLNVAGLDFSVSKKIGIASTFNLTPFGGYQVLWIISDSEVLDATPAVDGMGQTAAKVTDPVELTRCQSLDCNANFTFMNQSNITRHRLFLGVKANFYIASLIFQYNYFASGSTSDVIAAQAGVRGLVIPDEAGAQHSLNVSLAVDY